MKRVLLLVIILLAAGAAVFAQQQAATTIPTSSQTKQSAQQYLDQVNSNGEQFESTLDELKSLNMNNKDAYTFNRLKSEIDRIEATIRSEERAIRSSLDKGTKVNSEVVNRMERFINQHREKVAELETFIQSIQS